MAPHQNAPILRTRPPNAGISLFTIIRWSMFVSFLCGFAFMWSIYLEMSANYYGGATVERWVMEERGVRGSGVVAVEERRVDRVERSQTTSTKAASTSSSKEVAAVTENNRNPNRLYCMVPFIWTPSAFPAYHAIRNTWGKRCHITKFFIDPVIGDPTVGYYNMTDESQVREAKKANLTLPSDVVVLHTMKRPWHTCSDDDNQKSGKPIGNCRNIWEKIWRGWVYTVYGTTGGHIPTKDGENANGKTDVYNAEWFVKVDADTYLFPDNLPRYVVSRGWDFNDQHYFGHVLNHRVSDRKVSIVAGAAVFFSRATLLSAAETFNTMSMERGDEEEDGTCRDAYTGTEEVVTAVCIRDYVKAEPAVDDVGREQVSLYEVDLILEYNRTDQGEWWFWEGKKRFPCHDNPNDCIGHLPLAFHHLKNAEDILALDKEFYSDDVRGRKQNKGYVNEYFDKIRTAMRAAETLEAQGQSVVQSAIEIPNAETADGEERLQKSNEVSIAEPAHNELQKSNEQSMDALQPSSSNQNRLYCMVPFIWTPKYLPQYEAIRKTWGKRCDVLKFFIDPIIGGDNTEYQDVRSNETAKASLPDDVVTVESIVRPWNQCMTQGSKDFTTCRNIWEKLWRSWILMDETGELDKAEWFTKVDADTYLFADNLKRYVAEKNWLPSEQHYFGHVLMHRIAQHDANATIVAGAAVFFSRTTLKSLVGVLKEFKEGEKRNGHNDCKDDYTSEEEVITAVCLKKNFGVEAQTALDAAGKELIAVAEPEDSLVWNRTEQGEWWYWQNKPKVHPETGAAIHQCCGDRPLAFHGYKDPQWFYLLENEFYDAGFPVKEEHRWRYNWRNPDETKPYFERVKKALSD